MSIYVSNLDLTVENSDLKTLFEEFGAVNSATVVTDKYTGRSRGFGFVEMSDPDTADAALKGVDGRNFKGRALSASPAREKNNGTGGKSYS